MGNADMMVLWVLVIVIFILCWLMAMREWQNWRDRKDLLDRIMSADYREYKRHVVPAAAPLRRGNVRMTDEELATAEEEERKKS